MPRKLANSMIAVRAQEFHEGLMDAVFGAKEAHLGTTIQTGKVAALSSHLKGLNYVENIHGLIYLAIELGITRLELEPILRELEELDFATVVGTGASIRRIELRIPELRDGYEDIGERWSQLNPSELEQAAIHLLDDVAEYPRPESVIFGQLGIDRPSFDRILEISSHGALVDRQDIGDSEPVLFSPLTVEENPQALTLLARKFPQHRVVAALDEVKSQQGVPVSVLLTSDPEVIEEAVALGVLCPVQIVAGGKSHTFLFSPKGELTKEERIILSKARAILACVRYGEHFAGSRRIFSPLRILETLRDKKRFSRSRTDFQDQYGLLVKMQIGRIEPDLRRPGFDNFIFIDTPENMHAINIAIDLLELGRTSAGRLTVDAGVLFGVGGAYVPTLPTRARVLRGGPASRSLDREVIDEISRITRGIVR